MSSSNDDLKRMTAILRRYEPKLKEGFVSRTKDSFMDWDYVKDEDRE